jgi:hypothetical protein
VTRFSLSKTKVLGGTNQMPNDNSQATPAGQVIPAGVSVPETTAPVVSPQAEPQTEQKPLTLEDVRALAREEATRIAQSQVAKGENRINQRIQEKIAALNLNKDELGYSEEQLAQAKQKIINNAFTAEDVPPTSAPPLTPDVDQAIQYLNAEIQNVFTEVGASVTPTDPEFAKLQATVDAAWNDPKGLTKILLAAQQAATLKAQRVTSQQSNAAARVTSGGGSPTPGNTTASSAHDLWENAYKK